jgi:hypothetical protein
VILHCVVENKRTLRRPQGLVSKAHGVEFMAFFQCHHLW